MKGAPIRSSITRRHFLQVASLPLASSFFAGCGLLSGARTTESASVADTFNSDHPLAALRFMHQGVVSKDMRFEFAPQPVHIAESAGAWHVKGSLPYLAQSTGSEEVRRLVAPPIGMRSGLPLGGMGGGTIEIRADGSLRDWQIFNGSPASTEEKVDVEDFFVGLRTQRGTEAPRAWTLRTQPPGELPGVDRMAFAGAYPVARLVPQAEGLPLDVAWYAYSPFILNDPAFSNTPALGFTLLLHNPGNAPVDASVMCNLPNHTQGTFRLQRGITLTRNGDTPDAGTMTLETVTGFNLSSMVASELGEIWEIFEKAGTFDGQISMGLFDHGAAAARAVVEPGATQAVTFVLSWHFPNRTFNGANIGQGYAGRHTSAPDAAKAFIDRLPDVWNSLSTWQALCFDNSMPDALQDALANSPSILAKSAVFTGTQHWRFWDTFAAPSLSGLPTSLHRAMPLALFFPDILRDHLRAYAAVQHDDGSLPASLGMGRRTPFDGAHGPVHSDNAPAFILQVYAHLRATGDRGVFAELWPHARKAMGWQLERAARLELPDRLDSLYRWWQYDRKDLAAYGSMLHLAAGQAALRMAALAGDTAFASSLKDQLTTASKAFDEAFWTGDHYRAWRTADEPTTDALQADTLYGLLWCFQLEIDLPIPLDRARSHIRKELRDNASPYGLLAMRHAGNDADALSSEKPYRFLADGRGGPTDSVVWQAATYNSAALGIWLEIDPRRTLEGAERAAAHQYRTLRDPWNVFEMQAGWDGSPWAYSHHPAHLALWLLPLALSGQQYDAVARRLTFEPRIDAPYRIPFAIPTARGVLDVRGGGRYTVEISSGRLILEELRIGGEVVQRDVLLEAGQAVRIG
ncbi:MAG: GH116 family glycosyl-hydrolase [Rhodothermales bacterium]|nr:GH116 family glycosyl-hydrolase [Rhodothermales bacterium]